MIDQVTVYVNNRVDGAKVMTIDEVARTYWASDYADLDQYPWPRERSFGVFLMADLHVTIDPGDGVTQFEVLEAVLDRKPGGGW